MLVLFLVKALTSISESFSREDATSCSDSEYKAVEVYKPLIPNYQNCPLSPTATLMTVDASSTGTELGSTITRGQKSTTSLLLLRTFAKMSEPSNSREPSTGHTKTKPWAESNEGGFALHLPTCL